MPAIRCPGSRWVVLGYDLGSIRDGFVAVCTACEREDVGVQVFSVVLCYAYLKAWDSCIVFL